MLLIAVKIIIFRSINLNYYYKYYYSISYPPDTYHVPGIQCIHVCMCARVHVYVFMCGVRVYVDVYVQR